MKVSPIKTTNNINKIYGSNFKDFLSNKKRSTNILTKGNFQVNNFWQSINEYNDKGMQKFKKYLSSTKLTPVKLLKMQFNLNYHFLNQQILSKFVELPINSVKNITQSNV